MHIDEYRDAYDRPGPARVPRLGRREPGQAPEVTPEAAGPSAGHTVTLDLAVRVIRLQRQIAHHRREAARCEAELLTITRQETDDE